MAAVLAAVGAAATVLANVAGIFQIIDSLVQRGNIKEATKKLNLANKKIQEYNLDIEDLKNYMDRRGIQYNQAMQFYQNTVRGSNMDKNRIKIDKKYRSDINKAQNKTQEINSKINALNTYAQQEYNKQANSGIGDQLVEAGKSLYNSTIGSVIPTIKIE